MDDDARALPPRGYPRARAGAAREGAGGRSSAPYFGYEHRVLALKSSDRLLRVLAACHTADFVARAMEDDRRCR